jgi:hypothetical protein
VQIVESWGGNPGHASTTLRKGLCHHMPHAQHAHRVQMVHSQKETSVSQVLASHSHQASVLSVSPPGYMHAWRFCDGSLKATYAPKPLSPHGRCPHCAVPQPSQVLHWKYACSGARRRCMLMGPLAQASARTSSRCWTVHTLLR